MGISEQTFYRWKKLYGGLGTGELRRLKQLEEENRKLKQLVADLSLDKQCPRMGPLRDFITLLRCLSPFWRLAVTALRVAAAGRRPEMIGQFGGTRSKPP